MLIIVRYLSKNLSKIIIFAETSKNIKTLGKLKEIFRGPYRNFAWFFIATTVAFLWVWIIGPGNTIGHWINANHEASGPQAEEIAKYRNEIQELDSKIQALENNVDTLEKFAREQYHFAAPGEDVYVIE